MGKNLHMNGNNASVTTSPSKVSMDRKEDVVNRTQSQIQFSITPRKRKNNGATHRRRRRSKETAPWIIRLLSFVHFFFLQWLTLAPLRMLYTWISSYPMRAQAKRTERRYINIMNSTEDLETWLFNATHLDNHRGMRAWQKNIPDNGPCNANGLSHDAGCAAALSISGNERAMGEFLRSQLHRHAHGITSPSNFQYYTGTKHSVEEYNNAIVRLIHVFVGSLPEKEFLPLEVSSGVDVSSGSEARSPQKTQSLSDQTDSEGQSEAERCSANGAFSPSLVSSSGTRSEYLSSLIRWAYEPREPKEVKLTNDEKLTVLRDTFRSYGRSALMLSGGSTLGVYHTGVVRALYEAGLLPDIISGSSAGSIIAGIICTKPECELRTFLENSMLTLETLQLTPFQEDGFLQKLQRMLHTGAFMDVRTLMETLRHNMGDFTFLEAYRRTGRILNVCVTSDRYIGTHMNRHMLLNYVTTPNVVVWSAVSASCALPGLFSAVQLVEKTSDGTFHRYLPGQLWCDGSVARDLPRESLATLFNVNYFIVSQVNPHIIPFFKKPLSPLVYKQYHYGKVLSSLWYSCCHELGRWVLKLFDIGVISKTGIFEVPYMLLTQDYEGDVMILPIGNVLHAVPDYFNIVANPTYEYIAYVTSRAQLHTWPHLNKIRHVTMIERTLNHEIRRLSEST